jgi:hypothetical protein
LSEALIAPNITLAETRVYPIREITGAVTLADLAVAVEDFGLKIGQPRFALAHVITDVNKPAPFTVTPTTTWVLLTSEEGLGGAVTWRESVMEPVAGLLQHSGYIEMSVAPADVITITASQDAADLLNRMLEALESRHNSTSGMGLFVDFLLVEQRDAGDTSAWVLYRFTSVDEASAGTDWHYRLCRSFLRCSKASDQWTKGACTTFACAY